MIEVRTGLHGLAIVQYQGEDHRMEVAIEFDALNAILDDARQQALREVRDAIQKVYDHLDPWRDRSERNVLAWYVLSLFDKGERFEIEEPQAAAEKEDE